MKKITLYCDGSSLGNPGFGGWCSILKYNNKEKILSGSKINTTNNIMELTAVIESLKSLKQSCEIDLISDSKYVCEAINSWLQNWVLKDFKKVKNAELWKEFLVLSKKHKIKAFWVKGHNGHVENEKCDKIAKEAANNLKKSIQNHTQQNDTQENHINNKISEDFMLNDLQQKIQYTFKSKDILIEALTHKSYDKLNNNERLEFLGDAVLDLLVGEYVFKKLIQSNEGDLTKLRASIVNESSFAKLAMAINLGNYLFISAAEVKNKGREKPSILSNAFEALIGAIYIDGGLNDAKILSYRLLEFVYKEIDLENLFKDYKTLLQELTQSICGVIPDYILVDSSGPDHNKSFVMKIKINGVEYATQTGKSKKEAEQSCAKKAYEILKRENKNQ